MTLVEDIAVPKAWRMKKPYENAEIDSLIMAFYMYFYFFLYTTLQKYGVGKIF